VEVISLDGKNIVKKRMDTAAAGFEFSGSSGLPKAYNRGGENRETLEKLEKRILHVFDPEGIMIR
jgi:hypothetical protein